MSRPPRETAAKTIGLCPGPFPHQIWFDGDAVRALTTSRRPRSLDRQLLNVLNRARRDGVFLPWQYVLADAAVSGALACRRGSTLAKTLVERRNESGVAWFLIDDLSRMSRNTSESLRFGEIAEETGVRNPCRLSS